METLKEIAKRVEESSKEYERFDDWSSGLRLIRDATHRIFGIAPIASPYDLENVQACESVLGKVIENYRIVLRHDAAQNFHYYEQNPHKFMLKSIFHEKRLSFFKQLILQQEVRTRMSEMKKKMQDNADALKANLPQIEKRRTILLQNGRPVELIYQLEWNLQDIENGKKTYESLAEKNKIHPEILKNSYARSKWKWINQTDYESLFQIQHS